MKSRRLAIHTLALGLVLAGAPATIGLGQPVLRPNVKHDVGGSCVYVRNGAVVFTPPGVRCPDRTEHLKPTPGQAPALLIEGLPETMQRDVTKLFQDHAHINDELARLGKVLEAGDRKAAQQTLDKLTAEVVEHRVREEQLFQKMARERVLR